MSIHQHVVNGHGSRIVGSGPMCIDMPVYLSVKYRHMRIAIGSDHAGFDAKELVEKHLREKGLEVDDRGTHDTESVDYPDLAHSVAEQVLSGSADLGIVLCGSGNGVNISANKHAGIRSALAWTPEIALLARQHNDANILALPARFIDGTLALEIVDAFLAGQFEGGRHLRRVERIETIR